MENPSTRSMSLIIFLYCFRIVLAINQSFALSGTDIVTFEIDSKLFVSPIGEDVPFSFPANYTSIPLLTTAIPHGMNLSLAKQEFSNDDVWCEEFLANTCFTNTTPGPFLHWKNTLSPVYRIYPDPQDAFVSGLIPGKRGYFEPPIGGHDALSIPVPSRLYFRPSPEKPLSGVRVAVKDIYDISGLRTGGGSRAFYRVQEPAKTNAASIDRLIELGAVLVGKTKTSQFTIIGRCADWFDQLCPYNVRGDGYNDPSGSSSGSGAAIGAYDWLDVALGSDTGGSIRAPAANNGVFGVRPSWGTLNTSGVLPQSDLLDTLGYISRNITLMACFGKSWYNLNTTNSTVSRLLIPSDLWPSIYSANGSANWSNSASEVFTHFITNISDLLDVKTVNYSAFEDLWSGNESAKTYMNLTYPVLCGAHQYDVVGKSFISRYSRKFAKSPFIDPAVKSFWQYAKDQGQDAYREQRSRKKMFQEFIETLIDDETLMLYPANTGQPDSRISYGAEVPEPWGWSAFTISPFAGTPDIVLTIGEVNSSGQTLPVTVGMIAKRGHDYKLLALAKRFEERGIVKNVGVGHSILNNSTRTK